MKRWGLGLAVMAVAVAALVGMDRPRVAEAGVPVIDCHFREWELLPSGIAARRWTCWDGMRVDRWAEVGEAGLCDADYPMTLRPGESLSATLRCDWYGAWAAEFTAAMHTTPRSLLCEVRDSAHGLASVRCMPRAEYVAWWDTN